METVEYLLKLSRKAEDQAQDLRETLAKIDDVPVLSGRICVYSELIEAGLADNTDYGHGTAWSACNRLIEQRQQMSNAIAQFQNETEILTSIADDLIGQNGRLV